MRVRTASVAGTLLIGGMLCVASATPAVAAPCDAYSRTCPSTPPGTIDGGGTGGGSAPSASPTAGGNSNPGTTSGNNNGGTALPFTGAELALLTLVGGSAIAGGTMFVVAGRRRRTDAA
jgi:hypothetical protein